MTDPITIDVIDGTYTCPEHPDVGPIVLGYTGDAPPARVSVTHNGDGTHNAEPADDAPSDDAEEQAVDETPAVPFGDGGAGAGDQAPAGDGSPDPVSEGADNPDA